MTTPEPSDKISINLLIDRYLSSILTDQETELLLHAVQTDPNAGETLRLNILADFLLKENSDEAKKLKESLLGPDKSFEFPSLVDPQLNTVIVCPDPVDVPHHGSWFHHDVNGKKIFAQPFSLHLPYKFLAKTFLLISIVVTFAAGIYTLISHSFWNEGFQSVAKVSEIIDVVWDEHSETYKRGQKIGPNKIKFQSGYLQLVFNNGANLIVEGPAELVVEEELSLFCSIGQIHAHIPSEAKGFAITTSFGKFVDRGTDFSLQVQNDRASISVHKGRVDTFWANQPIMKLFSGQGSTREENGKVKEIVSQKSDYLSDERFATIVSDYSQKQLEKENSVANEFKNDSHLLLHVRSDRYENNRLYNLAETNQKKISEVQIFGCNRTEGKYHGLESLYFQNSRDRWEVDFPGRYQSLTILMTIRIDRIAKTGSTLVMSDRFYEQSGALAWQLSREGNLLLYLKKEDSNNQLVNKTFTTPVVYQTEDRGTWMSLALVLDGDRSRVMQYRDGVLIANTSWNQRFLLEPGKLIFGNVSNQNSTVATNFLHGAIDEIIVFDRVLNKNEIRKLGFFQQREKNKNVE